MSLRGYLDVRVSPFMTFHAVTIYRFPFGGRGSAANRTVFATIISREHRSLRSLHRTIDDLFDLSGDDLIEYRRGGFVLRDEEFADVARTFPKPIVEIVSANRQGQAFR